MVGFLFYPGRSNHLRSQDAARAWSDFDRCSEGCSKRTCYMRASTASEPFSGSWCQARHPRRRDRCERCLSESRTRRLD